MADQYNYRYPDGFICGRCIVFYQIKDIQPNTFSTETELIHYQMATQGNSDDKVKKVPLYIKKNSSADWTKTDINNAISAASGNNNPYSTVTIISQPTGYGISNAGHYEVSCLSPDTWITMSDYTQKQIKDVKVKEKILCANGKIDTVIFNDAEKNKQKSKYIQYFFSDGSTLKIINDHRVFNIEKNKYLKLSQFTLGEHTYNSNHEKVALIDKKEINQAMNHCTIWTKNYNSYYANGILCGNRFGNIKFVVFRKIVLWLFRLLIKLGIVR